MHALLSFVVVVVMIHSSMVSESCPTARVKCSFNQAEEAGLASASLASASSDKTYELETNACPYCSEKPTCVYFSPGGARGRSAISPVTRWP